VIASAVPFASNHQATLPWLPSPWLRMKLDSTVGGRAITVGGDVLRILGVSAYAKISPSIVKSISVLMIDFEWIALLKSHDVAMHKKRIDSSGGTGVNPPVGSIAFVMQTPLPLVEMFIKITVYEHTLAIPQPNMGDPDKH
jgi:hypothetical protein